MATYGAINPGAPGGAPGYPPQPGSAPGYGPPPGGAPGYGPPPGGAPGYGPPPGGAPSYGPPPGGAPGYGPPPGGAPGYGPPPAGAPGYPPAGAPGYPPAGAPGPSPPQQGDNEPSAPPLDKMDLLPGYEQLNTGAGAPAFLPPPSYEEAANLQPPDRGSLANLPLINDEEARKALLDEANSHCCWGKGAAREMKFTDINQSTAFQYTLETFGESRTTKWTQEPYHGQPIDSGHYGQPPGPWEIPCQPTQQFLSHKMKLEVPHTASVKSCHSCHGRGSKICWHCHGRGNERCSSCNGSGRSFVSQHHVDMDHENNSGPHHHHHHHNDFHPCTWCHGSGYRNCTWCHSTGYQKCNTCEGMGKLKVFIQLTVNYENHLEDFIDKQSSLPPNLLRNVSGQKVIEETGVRVFPLTNHSFPLPALINASEKLIQEHNSKWPQERLHVQRQRVEAIPVAEVFYDWKSNRDESFFVYGFEHRVHAPKYPQQSCCGCSLL